RIRSSRRRHRRRRLHQRHQAIKPRSSRRMMIAWTPDLTVTRSKRDEEIEDWATRLNDADLDGVVVWYPGDGSTRIEKPKALCAAELFNHQTHHRGQVHAMLTAAGAEPEPTNLSMLA
ncbi:hypothetical protein JF290_19275, partial [Sedimentitalea sp. CAU 1593]|nr:hypothetical protein [Arenibacterium arenosum]